MKTRCLAALSLVVLFAVAGLAQNSKPAKPPAADFSGRWISEKVTMTATPIRPRGGDNVKIELAITQAGNELRIKESTISKRGSYSRDVVYYLDGRGESNKGFTDGFVYETKTSLKHRKIFIDGTLQLSTRSIRTSEEWEISPDEQKLTIRTQSSGAGEVRYEKTFRRAN